MDPFFTTMAITGIGAFAAVVLPIRLRMRRLARLAHQKNIVKKHIKRHLSKGYSLGTSRKYLLIKGHDASIVHDIISKLELYQYVYRLLKKGHQPFHLKQHLLAHGWKEKHANATILHASNKLTESTRKRGSISMRTI